MNNKEFQDRYKDGYAILKSPEHIVFIPASDRFIWQPKSDLLIKIDKTEIYQDKLIIIGSLVKTRFVPREIYEGDPEFSEFSVGEIKTKIKKSWFGLRSKEVRYIPKGHRLLSDRPGVRIVKTQYVMELK